MKETITVELTDLEALEIARLIHGRLAAMKRATSTQKIEAEYTILHSLSIRLFVEACQMVLHEENERQGRLN